MIQKMGPLFVSMFALFIDTEKMEAIAANCPNLKELKIRLTVITNPLAENIRLVELKKCKQLKKLSLNLLYQGDDSSLNEIVKTETLEELIIIQQDLLKGSFLTNLRKNLKTLVFLDCKSLEIEHIRAVADRLTGLTRLELNSNSISTLENAHLLLDVTPNLKRLCLDHYENGWGRRIKLGSEVPTAIGRLSRLKELRLWNNNAVTDEWMAIVARGCPALRIVDVGCTNVSSLGLLELCGARPALKELVVCFTLVKDEDLEACARFCGGLELLDVCFCHYVTASLPARLTWPRARPLRLQLSDELQEKIEGHYDGITLLRDSPSYNYWPD